MRCTAGGSMDSLSSLRRVLALLVLFVCGPALAIECTEYRASGDGATGSWSASKNDAAQSWLSVWKTNRQGVCGIAGPYLNQKPPAIISQTEPTPVIRETWCDGSNNYSYYYGSYTTRTGAEYCSLCQTLAGQEFYIEARGTFGPGATTCNAVGCTMFFTGPTITYTDRESGVAYTEGEGAYTGGSCTYDPNVSGSNQEDTCRGGSVGLVNGVTTCVPYDPDLNVIRSTNPTTSTTSTGSGTSTVTTTTNGTTTTTCDGDSCVTITATRSTGSNGQTSTVTTTSTVSRSEFCTANPRHPSCVSGEGSFSGTCSAGFQCTGDAVSCAMSKAIHEMKCRLDPGTGTDTVKAALEGGTFGPTLPVQQKAVGNFDQSNPMGGSCPGDHTLSLAGASVVIPLSSVCSELQLMGNVLVAFTLLAATIFVVRGIGG